MSNIRTPILLACGHPSLATHTTGSRVVTCRECNEQTVIHATERRVVDYTSTLMPKGLRLGEQKEMINSLTEMSNKELGVDCAECPDAS